MLLTALIGLSSMLAVMVFRRYVLAAVATAAAVSTALVVDWCVLLIAARNRAL